MKKILLFGYWSEIWDLAIKNFLLKDTTGIFEHCEKFHDNIENYDYIIPVSPFDACELFEKEISPEKIIGSAPSIINLCDDKKKFSDFMIENNLKYLLPKMFEIKNDLQSDKLYIKKPRVSYGSIDVYVKKGDEINNDDFDKYLIQDYVRSNEELVTHMYLEDGKCLHSKSYKYVFINDNENNIKCDNCNFTLEKYDLSKDDEEKLLLFLKIIKYTGFCNVNYKKIDSQIFIFEYNPRLGGSIVKNEEDFKNILMSVAKNKILD